MFEIDSTKPKPTRRNSIGGALPIDTSQPGSPKLNTLDIAVIGSDDEETETKDSADNTAKNPSSSANSSSKPGCFSESTNQSNRNSVYLLPGMTATNSRSRRRNSEVDAVHKIMTPEHVSPAQLYSTESGHLYHAGKICIILVGLPARGKTHHAVSLTRYLRWLGVKTHAFHLGDYRRKLSGPDFVLPEDYFRIHASVETKALRQRIVDACFEDIDTFLFKDNGQVVIYDAVNGTADYRRKLARKFEASNVTPFFVECLATDEELVIRNIRDVKITSPDYKNMDPDEAVRHYLNRIEERMPDYQPMNEPELSYVKLINVCEKIVMNMGKTKFGYLQNRVIYFLMNSRIKVGSVFFARAGVSEFSEDDYKADGPLSSKGLEYAEKLKETLWEHIDMRRVRRKQDDDLKLLKNRLKVKSSKEGIYYIASQDGQAAETETDEGAHANHCDHCGHSSSPSPSKSPSKMIHAASDPNLMTLINNAMKLPGVGEPRRASYTDSPMSASGMSTPQSAQDALAVSTIRADQLNDSERSSLIVWSSSRLRTVQTAAVFAEEGIIATQRTQLTQLNPGEAGHLTQEQLKSKYPEEFKRHQEDPYHHRYPRAESYQDVAVRLEPLIMEMERTPGDLLIIAHETVLQVLYGYLMACSVNDIPKLKFPINEVVEIIPNAYMNQANRIEIPGVEP